MLVFGTRFSLLLLIKTPLRVSDVVIKTAPLADSHNTSNPSRVTGVMTDEDVDDCIFGKIENFPAVLPTMIPTFAIWKISHELHDF